MRSKDVKLVGYLEHKCGVCKGNLNHLEQDRLRNWCYVCARCERKIPVKVVLTNHYHKELRGVNSLYRKKFLDMMVRDVVRYWKRKLEAERNPAPPVESGELDL